MGSVQTAAELIRLIPQSLKAGAVDDVSAVIQFNVNDPVHVMFSDGQATTGDGVHPGPDITVTVSDKDLEALLRGKMRMTAALFTGKLKVRGNVPLGQRLLSAIDRERIQELAGVS